MELRCTARADPADAGRRGRRIGRPAGPAQPRADRAFRGPAGGREPEIRQGGGAGHRGTAAQAAHEAQPGAPRGVVRLAGRRAGGARAAVRRARAADRRAARARPQAPPGGVRRHAARARRQAAARAVSGTVGIGSGARLREGHACDARRVHEAAARPGPDARAPNSGRTRWRACGASASCSIRWRARNERSRRARQPRRTRARRARGPCRQSAGRVRRPPARHAAGVQGDPRQRLDRHRLHARPQVHALQPEVRRDVRLEGRGADRPARRRGLPLARELRGDGGDRGAGARGRPPARRRVGGAAQGRLDLPRAHDRQGGQRGRHAEGHRLDRRGHHRAQAPGRPGGAPAARAGGDPERRVGRHLFRARPAHRARHAALRADARLRAGRAGRTGHFGDLRRRGDLPRHRRRPTAGCAAARPTPPRR